MFDDKNLKLDIDFTLIRHICLEQARTQARARIAGDVRQRDGRAGGSMPASQPHLGLPARGDDVLAGGLARGQAQDRDGTRRARAVPVAPLCHVGARVTLETRAVAIVTAHRGRRISR